MAVDISIQKPIHLGVCKRSTIYYVKKALNLSLTHK